jgi:hypothetical protein
MKRIDRMPASLACRMLVPFLLALGLLAPPAGAQNANVVANSNEALARVAQLANDVRAMRTVAQIPIGPYDLSTECTWCSEHAWWGLGMCTQNTTERWHQTVDFSWTRGRLNYILDQAERSANDFPRAFAPIQAWIGSLPAFSAKFNQTADIVLNVEQQIKSGVGPNDQQRQVVTQALQTMIDQLTGTATQLSDATKILAADLQQQSAYGPSIKQAMDGADRSANDALASLQKAASTHHCQDGLSEKFNAIKGNFSTSIAQISAAFQKLEADRQAADRGLAFLLGNVVSLRTDVQSVMDLVKAAGADKLGSFLERLHLSAAKTQLQQIANYSATQLAKTP